MLSSSLVECMVVWFSGWVVVWFSGLVVIWFSGWVVVWFSGWVVVLFSSCLVLRLGCFLVLWLGGCLVLWLSGCLVLRSSSLALRLGDYLALRLSGCFALWLNVHKACGPDNLSSHVLKKCATVLAPSLAHLFTRSFNSGCIHAQWKQGNVVPAHKKGDKSQVCNYRPISLLCIVSKVMEKIFI